MASRSPTSPPSALTDTRPEKNTQDESKSEHAKELATESDPHEDCDELCELCGSLNIDTLVSDYGGDGKLYDLGALIDSASRCKTCEGLFNLEELRDVDGAECDNSIWMSFRIERTNGSSYGFLEVCPDYPDDAKNVEEHVLVTDEGDVASTRHGLLTLQAMGASTASGESFRSARTWLDGCTLGHAELRPKRLRNFRTAFGKPKFETRWGPARLIDVFATGRDAGNTENELQKGWDSDHASGNDYLHGRRESSRVVDGANTRGPYAALSYCWGSHPYEGYITTKANLHARMGNLVEDKLPKTFQHAIYIARRLEVRYLWIDAVCIIQDSREDWLEESGKMGSIFADALLTLVAAQGDNSEAGMFNSKSIFGGECNDQRIALQTVLPGNTIRTTLYCVPFNSTHLSERSHLHYGPLGNRAWCLQEDLLSARKLYYAYDQLYWHCDHLTTSEDGLATAIDSFYDDHDHNTLKEPERALRASYLWYKVVISEEYADRIATLVTDRLVAVSGLARHLATAAKCRYLAGLWEVSILEGLLWRPTIHKKHNVYCAPSWSWASQHGGVWWDLSVEHDTWQMVSGCQYVRAKVEFSSSDEFGGVTNAALTIRSKLIELTMEGRSRASYHESEPTYHASYQGIKGWAVLDEEMTLPSLFAFPITHEISLVVARNSASETYCRVGIWCVHGRGRFDLQGGPYENFRRWTAKVLPTLPVTEITII